MNPLVSSASKNDVVLRVEHVGSRVTCDPPPTDTDDDWLVLVRQEQFTDNVSFFANALRMQGWKLGGSLPANEGKPLMPDERFMSLTRDGVNIIATESPLFFDRFIVATRLAKRLNLLDKADRIALFQAVLYGKAV